MGNYAGTYKDIFSYNLVYNLWYRFCHCKVQFLWCTFQTHFGMETRDFQKVVLRTELFLSLYSFICKYRCLKIRFYSCSYQNQIFSIVLHSCCSFSTRVTCFACISLVLDLFCLYLTRVARVCHSGCKTD